MIWWKLAKLLELMGFFFSKMFLTSCVALMLTLFFVQTAKKTLEGHGHDFSQFWSYF